MVRGLSLRMWEQVFDRVASPTRALGSIVNTTSRPRQTSPYKALGSHPSGVSGVCVCPSPAFRKSVDQASVYLPEKRPSRRRTKRLLACCCDRLWRGLRYTRVRHDRLHRR